MKKLLAALLLCSCLDNSLGGSLSEVFPLEISGTELRRNDQALQVTYFRNRGVFLGKADRFRDQWQLVNPAMTIFGMGDEAEGEGE